MEYIIFLQLISFDVAEWHVSRIYVFHNLIDNQVFRVRHREGEEVAKAAESKQT